MHWIRKSKAAALVSFCLIAAIPVTGLQAEPIIIKYEGPNSQNYKPGRKLLPAAKISLKTGEVLTVLDERGTRTLRGPGTFNASSAASAGNVSNTNLATLIKTSSVRRARTGAVRGESPPQQTKLSPNLWYIDIKKSAKFCVADFQSLQLWGSDAAETQPAITIAGASGGNAIVKFGKGRSTVRWPSAVAPVDGGQYTISAAGKADKISIAMVKIDVTGEERLDTMALKLLDRGCQAQSELLAATFVQAEPVPAGGQ
jgi:hypothetical protein